MNTFTYTTADRYTAHLFARHVIRHTNKPNCIVIRRVSSKPDLWEVAYEAMAEVATPADLPESLSPLI